MVELSEHSRRQNGRCAGQEFFLGDGPELGGGGLGRGGVAALPPWGETSPEAESTSESDSGSVSAVPVEASSSDSIGMTVAGRAAWCRGSA